MSELVTGFYAKKPHDKAPDFVKATVSIKIKDFAQWIKDNKEDEWINIQILESKNGNWYAKKNDFKPETKVVEVEGDDLPF